MLVLALRKSEQAHHNSSYEERFRALKFGRTVTYAVLAACQVGRAGCAAPMDVTRGSCQANIKPHSTACNCL